MYTHNYMYETQHTAHKHDNSAHIGNLVPNWVSSWSVTEKTVLMIGHFMRMHVPKPIQCFFYHQNWQNMWQLLPKQKMNTEYKITSEYIVTNQYQRSWLIKFIAKVGTLTSISNLYGFLIPEKVRISFLFEIHVVGVLLSDITKHGGFWMPE